MLPIWADESFAHWKPSIRIGTSAVWISGCLVYFCKFPPCFRRPSSGRSHPSGKCPCRGWLVNDSATRLADCNVQSKCLLILPRGNKQTQGKRILRTRPTQGRSLGEKYWDFVWWDLVHSSTPLQIGQLSFRIYAPWPKSWICYLEQTTRGDGRNKLRSYLLANSICGLSDLVHNICSFSDKIWYCPSMNTHTSMTESTQRQLELPGVALLRSWRFGVVWTSCTGRSCPVFPQQTVPLESNHLPVVTPQGHSAPLPNVATQTQIPPRLSEVMIGPNSNSEGGALLFGGMGHPTSRLNFRQAVWPADTGKFPVRSESSSFLNPRETYLVLFSRRAVVFLGVVLHRPLPPL